MRQAVKECCASLLTVALFVTLLPAPTGASRPSFPLFANGRFAEHSEAGIVGFPLLAKAGEGERTEAGIVRSQVARSEETRIATALPQPVRSASAKPQELPRPAAGFLPLPGQSRTLLPGGRILVTGGASKDGPVSDAWLLDPASGLAAKLP